MTIKCKNRMINVRDVYFKYPSNDESESAVALDGVSLYIEKGEFVGIIGHNGSEIHPFQITECDYISDSG